MARQAHSSTPLDSDARQSTYWFYHFQGSLLGGSDFEHFQFTWKFNADRCQIWTINNRTPIVHLLQKSSLGRQAGFSTTQNHSNCSQKHTKLWVARFSSVILILQTLNTTRRGIHPYETPSRSGVVSILRLDSLVELQHGKVGRDASL